MKKLFSMFAGACVLLAALGGCAQGGAPAENAHALSVVSTIFAPYDFAREIAGGRAEITMLLPPGSESHSYEPTPRDMLKIQNCDVFVYVGGESDAWVHEVLESIDLSGIEIVALMDCVDAVEEEIVPGMQGDHGDEEPDVHEEGESEAEHQGAELDEHVWTSPQNAKRIVQKLSDALCAADPAGAERYRQNTEGYLAELDQLDAAFRAAVDSAARKTIVFGDRFPFRYLADAYGLEYFAAFPGCSTETEASAATVAGLIDRVKSEKIPVVFHAELSNRKMADAISEATGAKVLLLHACHNVTKAEFESGASYLDLMRQNVENLREALD